MLPIAIMVKETETLPNRIREWKIRRNIKTAELAERVGTSIAQIQRMETGTRTVSFQWAERLAKALDVTPGELLAKEDNPFLPTDREKALLELIRKGGESLLCTVEAVAKVQTGFVDAGTDNNQPVTLPDDGRGARPA